MLKQLARSSSRPNEYYTLGIINIRMNGCDEQDGNNNRDDFAGEKYQNFLKWKLSKQPFQSTFSPLQKKICKYFQEKSSPSDLG